MENLQRIGACACGALKVVTHGEPRAVVACHCQACQRRTGSVFGVGAYFPEDAVRVEGATREFVRPTDAGNLFLTQFCPQCGTSLHWRTDRHPGLVGVAVGAFADPGFPAPVRSVWERTRHPWVEVGGDCEHFAQGRVG